MSSNYLQQVTAVIDTSSAFGTTLKQLKDNVTALQTQMATLLADAPETLDTLNEIAAAISDDPAFFTTMSTANTTLQTNIDALQAAAANARTALQTLLQGNIDAEIANRGAALTALQADVDQNESDADAAIALRAPIDGPAFTGQHITHTAGDEQPTTHSIIGGFPDLILKTNQGDFDTHQNEGRILWDDAGGASWAAIKSKLADNQTLDFYVGGVTASDKVFSLSSNEGNLTGNFTVAKSYPDITLKAGDEKRILFSDAGGSATAALKHVSGSLDFYVGGIGGSNKEMSLDTDGLDVSALKIDGTAVSATAAEINGFDARLDTLEADPTTKTYVDAQVTNLIDAAPGALDTLNELAAALGDDANFATTITNSIAAVQADVDQNEADADNAIALANAAMLAAVATVQADVDQNESDADAAIALKYDKTGGTVTGNVVIAKNFPDVELKSGDEKRILFADAGGAATAALKHVGTSLDFYAGGIGGSNKVFTLEDDAINCEQDVNLNDARVYFNAGSQLIRLKDNQTSALKVENGDGSTLDFLDFKTTNSDELLTFGAPNLFNGTVSIAGLTDAANDSAAATAGVAVNQLYRNGSVVMIRVS